MLSTSSEISTRIVEMQPSTVSESRIVERRVVEQEKPSVSSHYVALEEPSAIDFNALNRENLLPLRHLSEEPNLAENPKEAAEIAVEKPAFSKTIETTDESEIAATRPEIHPEQKPSFSRITFPESDRREIAMKPPQKSISKPALPPEVPKDIEEEPLQIPAPITTIRGQAISNFASGVEEALSHRPPIAQGPVDPGVIPTELTKNAQHVEELPLSDVLTEENAGTEGVPSLGGVSSVKKEKPRPMDASFVNGALLVATIISTMMLIYAVVIAFDYRQRWMQSLTLQNTRFSSVLDDGEDLAFSDVSDYYVGIDEPISYGYSVGQGSRRFSSDFFEASLR